MMKRIILSLLLVLALSSYVFAESFDVPKKFIRITIIKSSCSDVSLEYDNQTKIVYIISGWREKSIFPYYSQNGKLCKYDETSKKLVEIE